MNKSIILIILWIDILTGAIYETKLNFPDIARMQGLSQYNRATDAS